VLLRVDAADRLACAVARRGPLPATDAAGILLALAGERPAIAAAVLADVVERDARLAWLDGAVTLAPAPGGEVPLESARFAVLDVETTGFVAGTSTIRELGAVLVQGRLGREFRAEPSGPGATERSVRRLLAFVGEEEVVVGHNLRFDLGFLDHELVRAGLGRVAAPTVDTMVLGRRLLHGRTRRVSLAALAEFFGTSNVPCHRALPDARATAEVLLCLVAVAVERGARTVADLCALARPGGAPVDHLA